ncbi:MAG: flagellar biosynthetic protein FliR [Gemmatimonadota bacterium]
MNDAIRQLLAPTSWPTFVFIVARLAGLMLVAPLWSLTGMPKSLRGAVAVLLAGMLTAGAPKLPFPSGALDIPLPLFSEFVIGLVIGLSAAVIVQGVMMASDVVALQTGLSLGQTLTPNIDTGGPAIAQLQGLLATGVYVTLGGHLMLIESLAKSLRLIPPGTIPSFDGGLVAVLLLVSQFFVHVVQIAAPILVAVTITNMAVGVLGRAVPQLNAMAMSFAVSIGVGLVMLGVAAPFLASQVARWTTAMPRGIDSILSTFTVAPGAR